MSKAKRRTRETETTTTAKKKVTTPGGANSMINWLCGITAVLPIMYSSVTMDPNITVRYLFLGIMMTLMVLYFFLWKKVPSFNPPMVVKVIFFTGLGFIAWSLLASTASINKAAPIYEIARYTLWLLLLFIVTTAVYRESDKVYRICNTIVVVSIINSIIGIFQYYELAFTQIPGANAFPFGLMGNRNLFGSALALTIPFIIFSLVKGSRPWKITAITSIGLAIMSIVVSQTRSAWLSTAVIMIVSMVLIFIFSKEDRKRWIVATGIALATTGLIVLFLFATERDDTFSTSVRERALSLADAAPDSSQVTSNATERVKIWNKTIQLIKDKPIMGTGPGNWKIAIPSYGTEGLVWASGKFVPDRPHNEYLRTASETGIPGAILYFGMWVLVTIAGFGILTSKANREQKILTILMLSGLAAFAVDCMFSFPVERIEHGLFITLMGGIIIGIYNRQATSLPVKKWLVWLAVIITIFNVFMGFKKYQFETNMNLAKAYEAEGRFAEEIDAAESGKSSFVTIDPNGYPLELRTANAYQGSKNYAEALKEFNRAIEYNPNNVTLYTNIGTVYTDMKLYTKAIEYYNKALKVAPDYDIALKNLAVNYFETGKYVECINTLSKVDVNSESFLISLLNEAQNRLKK